MTKKLRPFVIIIVVVILVMALRFAYYTVIKNIKQDTISLNIDKPSISGIYPHLAVFNENHLSEKPGGGCHGVQVYLGKTPKSKLVNFLILI